MCPVFKIHGGGVDFICRDDGGAFTWPIWDEMSPGRRKIVAAFAYCAWMEVYDECLEVIKVGPTTQDQAAAAEEMGRAEKIANEWLEWGGWRPRAEGL